jgi:hypothetical protein
MRTDLYPEVLPVTTLLIRGRSLLVRGCGAPVADGNAF